MRHLSDLLASLPLGVPSAPGGSAPGPIPGCDTDLVETLGAGLPAGHLHVWGGPSGAGKTSFLLCLLYGAASHGRRVAYATYDLAAPTLALRLLGMAAHVAPDALADGRLAGEDLDRAARAREALGRLPFWFLEARGMGTGSIADRLVRMPFRPDVLAVDYLQAVVRPLGSDLGHALRDLSAMAAHLHLAVVCALRSPTDQPTGAAALESALGRSGERADRLGWIAPAVGSGLRRAEVLRNRYGDRPTLPFRMDPTSGRLEAERGP